MVGDTIHFWGTPQFRCKRGDCAEIVFHVHPWLWVQAINVKEPTLYFIKKQDLHGLSTQFVALWSANSEGWCWQNDIKPCKGSLVQSTVLIANIFTMYTKWMWTAWKLCTASDISHQFFVTKRNGEHYKLGNSLAQRGSDSSHLQHSCITTCKSP